jgi:uncharacterized protein YegL
MAEQVPFGGADVGFMDNPEPRVPCVLLLDTSGSMGGLPIEELNKGLSLCKSELLADGLAAKRVELAVVTFGGNVNVVTEFTTVEQFNPPTLSADGNTPMGQAILKGIDMLTLRKQTYRANGIAYYRPWIFLITDGAPTDPWHDAAAKIKEGERTRGFLFFSVGVENADFGVLGQLSEQREPLKLKGLRFSQLFQWVSSSLTRTSNSTTNEQIKLENPTTPAGWAEVPAGH